MSASWGSRFKITLFGESHGPAIGVVLDGLPPGFALDEQAIDTDMRRRAPGQSAMATKRREADKAKILSGLYQGHTTGAPLCAVIENTDTRSKDYGELADKPRPGHADFTGYVRFKGYNDPRGGGHFSGRLTAPLVFAGAVARQLLARRGIAAGSHAAAVADVSDRLFDPVAVSAEQFRALSGMELPVLDAQAGERMKRAVLTAAERGDSVGGVVECAVTGLPAGWGSPFFDSVESRIAAMLFSVPAVKGVEFGAGFAAAAMTGSRANDPFVWEDGRVRTTANRSGGIQGGITNGMPLIVRAAIKPTASISLTQDTVSLSQKTNAKLTVTGRHDPCIVPRALVVIESAVLIALLDTAMADEGWNL